VPPGRYQLGFATKPILVQAGKTIAGVNARIAVGGRISGRITNSSGKPVSYACAFAFNSDASSFVTNPTAQDGRYPLTGLGSGSYTVELGPCDQTVNLITVLRHVKVVAPRATTGVNATLRLGGSATGTVTAASAGLPLANTCAFFMSGSPNNPGGFGITDANGKYLAAGIEPGKYTVNFDDRGCESAGSLPSLAPQWFDNQPTQATANPVTIAVGHTVTGITQRCRTREQSPARWRPSASACLRASAS
jgi:hypothetical protein